MGDSFLLLVIEMQIRERWALLMKAFDMNTKIDHKHNICLKLLKIHCSKEQYVQMIKGLFT